MGKLLDLFSWLQFPNLDHLGRDFARARADLRMPQMTECDAILTEDGLNQVWEHLYELKKSGMGQRRTHQIARLFRRNQCALTHSTSGKETGILDETAYGELIQRIAATTDGEKDAHVRRLNDPLHWKCHAKLPAKWFHLLELWNYGGYPELQEPVSGRTVS